ncbi:MAG: HTTM domain-containing protein [Pirellulaceae bacterium]
MNTEPHRTFDNSSPTAWQRVFGFDSRSLALYRIILGLMTFYDGLMRYLDIRPFYSDAGYFSRSLMETYYQTYYELQVGTEVWSLHALSGEEGWQATLFGIQMAMGILISLGLFTRVANVVAWFLVASHQIRSPLVMTAGDFVLKLSLFWSIFMPLARHWAVERVIFNRWGWYQDLKLPHWISSFGTAGFLLQFVVMYFCTGIAKCNDVWYSGEAMYFVLNLDIYARPFSKTILAMPALLKLITWSTLFFELIGIWLLLIPYKNTLWRMINFGAYWMFHLGIAATLNIGPFPFICLMIWLPLLPSGFWNSVTRRSEQIRIEHLTSAYHLVARKITNVFCAIMIGVLVVWNAANIEELNLRERIPSPVTILARMTSFEQHFQMFGIPPKRNPWFVYEGKLADGTKVDLFNTTGELFYSRPENEMRTFPGHHWRKLHRNLMNPVAECLRSPLLEYAVQEWNLNHDDSKQVVSARLICYSQALGYMTEDQHITSDIWGTYRNGAESNGRLFDDLENRLNSEDGFPFD